MRIHRIWRLLQKLGLSDQDRFCFSLGSQHRHKNMDWVVFPFFL